jgi:hypothetical protein
LYDINNLNNSYLTRSSKFPVFQPILDDSYEYASQIGEEKTEVLRASASTATRAATDFTPHLPGKRIEASESRIRSLF